MRGMTDDMTIGERMAFYRLRRGKSQEVVAGLVGRTADWVRKVEHNRIPLDRLSVIRDVTSALDVSLGDLIGEPALMEWTEDSGRRTVPALRVALMDHRQFIADVNDDVPVALDQLDQAIAGAWSAYQDSDYACLIRGLPFIVTDTHAAVRQHPPTSDEGMHSLRMRASAHQLASLFLTKLGEADLAYVAATNGLSSARASGDELMVGSLLRAVAHALLSIGECEQALILTRAGADEMEPRRGNATAEYLSVYGMLHLVGAVAASRLENRTDTTSFLTEAGRAARDLGHDANHLWTAFGPTNVGIHRVTAAMELGDVQVAVDLGPNLDTSGLPIERQVRHAIETARALARWNRTDQALDTLLAAEQHSAQQVRYHRLSRLLVRELLHRPRPDRRALELAQRMGVNRTEP